MRAYLIIIISFLCITGVYAQSQGIVDADTAKVPTNGYSRISSKSGRVFIKSSSGVKREILTQNLASPTYPTLAGTNSFSGSNTYFGTNTLRNTTGSSYTKFYSSFTTNNNLADLQLWLYSNDGVGGQVLENLLTAKQNGASLLVGINKQNPTETLDVGGNIQAIHFVGNSTAPTVAAGSVFAGATGVSLTLSGNDTAGIVSFSEATSGSGTGIICTITFNQAYTNPPVVVVFNIDGTFGPNNTKIYAANVTTTTFDIGLSTSFTSTGTTYKVGYLVIGK